MKQLKKKKTLMDMFKSNHWEPGSLKTTFEADAVIKKTNKMCLVLLHCKQMLKYIGSNIYIKVLRIKSFVMIVSHADIFI